ncbi:MAG: hypothetical protein Q7K42_03310 [Candidatus Diapherotrites archaeon]|nr:hypothetical protein [Candidatus Diapherotrites archaeon]
MAFVIAGIIGLILISSGVLLKKRKTQDIVFIIGGIFLTAYSYSIGDMIFIVLQIVFILASMYSLYEQLQSQKKKKN